MKTCKNCGFDKVPENKLQCPKCRTFQGEETLRRQDTSILLKDVQVKELNRLRTGPWDEVWGSNWKTGQTGIVYGSTNLLAGLRGCGKSTLALQMCSNVSMNGEGEGLYLASEEPLEQIKDRADRLQINVDAVRMVSLMGGEANDIGEIVELYKPIFLVLDSASDLAGGNLQNEVSICKTLKVFCGRRMIPCIILSHVNKGGDVAGLEALQHTTDSVVTFFPEGDEESSPRVLHVEKNRNGKAMINYALSMTVNGLIPFDPALGVEEEDNESEDDSEEEDED